MKTVRVVAAIIIENGKVFATQRGYGEFKDGWEFPGGKIEPGETPEEAIVREIKEELDTEVEVIELLDTVIQTFIYLWGALFVKSNPGIWCSKNMKLQNG